MSAFVILLDGDVTPSDRLLGMVAGRRVIAADGGIRHAEGLGLVPELWLGDFDSVSADAREAYDSVPQLTFPQDKDQTDGELAAAVARERGARDILLAGSFGGPRADHAFLHAMHGLRLVGDGLAVTLSDGIQEGHPLLAGTHSIDLPAGTLFSIIGFTELTGLGLSGCRWPLARHHVPFGSSLTLSNVALGPLEITLATGKALLVARFDGRS